MYAKCEPSASRSVCTHPELLERYGLAHLLQLAYIHGINRNEQGTNMTDTKNCLEVKLAEFREMNAYHLADMAGCGTPDTLTSPGAVLLDLVRVEVLDSWVDAAPREGRTDEDRDGIDWVDTATNIADNAPSVYTHDCWTQFLDLCAYNEDISDWLGGELPDDLNKISTIAVYSIADRLARLMFEALVEELECDCCTDDEADDES